MALLAAKYGRVPVAQSLAPAIRLARFGFPLTSHLHEHWRGVGPVRCEPDVARISCAACRAAVGTLIRQPELAATLEHLAQHGSAVFTRGNSPRSSLPACARRAASGPRLTSAPIARSSAHRSSGSTGGARRFGAAAQLRWHRTHRGAEHPLAVRSAQRTPVQRKHLVIEAMRRVHRDRALYLGDPDFVDIPWPRLTVPTTPRVWPPRYAWIAPRRARPCRHRRRCRRRSADHAFLGARSRRQSRGRDDYRQFRLRTGRMIAGTGCSSTTRWTTSR